MRVLVACEFSGAVRRAFRSRGHDAWSCDLEPAEDLSPHHIRGDAAAAVIDSSWDLVIAHPPCRYLAASGARYWKDRQAEQAAALAFVRALWAAPCPRMALENPVGAVPRALGKCTQVVQPWWFGHPVTKATCLWLRGLPKLRPTMPIVPAAGSYIVAMAPGPARVRERSRTLPGFADAMAEQWGAL